MPNYDLGLLITLNIGLTLIGLLTSVIGIGMITRHLTQATRDITHEVREVAEITRTVAFMVRRQYGDIDRDLQEIKEMLGGS